MKKLMFVTSLICLALCVVKTQAREPKDEAQIWAAISVTQAIFQENETERMQIFFAVVNDGIETANPEIEHSHLFVNDKEMEQWNFIINNGAGNPERNALPPGHSYFVTVSLGEYFKQPGIYKVRWEGKAFKAPEIMFRVMPKLK